MAMVSTWKMMSEAEKDVEQTVMDAMSQKRWGAFAQSTEAPP